MNIVEGNMSVNYKKLAPEIRNKRVSGNGFDFLYGTADIDESLMGNFNRQSKENDLVGKYKAITSGDIWNKSENRMVLHHLLRADKCSSGIKEKFDFYASQRDKCFEFAKKVHGSDEFCDFVQIGIGGSILGAQLLYDAFSPCVKRAKDEYRAFFVSNIDKEYLMETLDSLRFDKTLFIFVSKSGTTYETQLAKTWIEEYVSEKSIKGFDLKKHSVAVTSETSPMAKGDGYFEKFFIDDYVGGRYSISSPCAMLITSIVYGQEACEEFLSGMRDMDALSLKEKADENPAMLAALYSVYENLKQSKNISVCLPYAEGAKLLPLYLQQLVMESNGKNHDHDGKYTKAHTGQFFFGDRGTCAQHSFCQLLHQGNYPFSLEFICFRDKHELFMSAVSQCLALYCGDKDKGFDGDRSSTMLLFEKYSPKSLGQIISFYENKTMFQGFMYGINSFDQPGVELGKKLLKAISAGSDADLKEVADSF